MGRQRANRYISILYRYSQRYFAQQLHREGLPIDVGDIPYLMQACRHPGISQEGISANLCMDKGTVARGLCHLEQNGLITRVPSESDKRVNLIYPTQQAQPVFQQAVRLVEQYHEMLYRGLSDQEVQTAVDLLIRMKNNVSLTLGDDRTGSD